MARLDFREPRCTAGRQYNLLDHAKTMGNRYIEYPVGERASGRFRLPAFLCG